MLFSFAYMILDKKYGYCCSKTGCLYRKLIDFFSVTLFHVEHSFVFPMFHVKHFYNMFHVKLLYKSSRLAKCFYPTRLV